MKVWCKSSLCYVEPDMDAIAEIVDKMQHGEPEPVETANGEDGEIPAEPEDSMVQ